MRLNVQIWVSISRVGRLPRLWLAYAAALAMVGARGRRAAVRALVAGCLTDRLVTCVLKPYFRRSRPDRQVQWWGTPHDSSFPSAHAANGFAFVTAVGHVFPPLRAPSYIAAAAIALSRLALRHHHATDVIAGAGLGYTVAHGMQFLQRALKWD